MLSPGDFAAFFREVYGYDPFPWQMRLARQIADEGRWPSTLDLPTGSGKTAAIDIAVFHLALEADRGHDRRAPVRIAFVVDRRLVVDDSFVRAQQLAGALAASRGEVTSRVASRLRLLAADGAPLAVRRLRGGIPREDDWARTPSQPTVLCSTVDQVGSRLLFRGYGVSDSMKPVHAGLIGSDCLILLDEAHLAEPFRQTLGWVEQYRGPGWRDAREAAPWGVSLLTATPGARFDSCFSLDESDRAHPILRRRLDAPKPARLLVASSRPIPPIRSTAAGSGDSLDDESMEGRVLSIVEQVRRAFQHFAAPDHGTLTPAIGVVVNRVGRARRVFDRLTQAFADEIEGARFDAALMIGAARPVDRDELNAYLSPIRTGVAPEGGRRLLERPLVLVATQCIEAGVDIDLDALITDIAPLDALRQRFGRLNRGGRDVRPYAAVVASKADISARHDDPVYGRAMRHAWEYLTRVAREDDGVMTVDFGVTTFTARIADEPLPPNALSDKPDAPVLLPAHLDMLSHTAPIPAADPEVALWLHGPGRDPDSVTVVWRADIAPERQGDEATRRLLALVPPRSSEAIELPAPAVRRWLAGRRELLDAVADVAAAALDEDDRPRDLQMRPRVFRWRGDEESSRWISPIATGEAIRPGDTIVVPASEGGVDRFGWNPASDQPALDAARDASLPFAGRRFAVRVAPGLIGNALSEDALADALAAYTSEHWQDVRAALERLPLPEHIRQDLAALDNANRKGSVAAHLDLYGTENGRPRGVVFVAPFGIRGRWAEEASSSATEDDVRGSLTGLRVTLEAHCTAVERKVESFARVLGLPEARIADLRAAALLHDAGKADPRFQAWLHHGDPLGPDPAQILAKSDRRQSRTARTAAGLPDRWRHEACSVRVALLHPRFVEADDQELVLWLIGTHHGHGRPFFPHSDPADSQPRTLSGVPGLAGELPAGAGPQSLAFEWNGADWTTLFGRLQARYGVWELARMEAILRLADHRASESPEPSEGSR